MSRKRDERVFLIITSNYIFSGIKNEAQKALKNAVRLTVFSLSSVGDRRSQNVN